MSRYKPIHLGIALLGLVVLGTSFLPWRDLYSGGSSLGLEENAWQLSGWHAKGGAVAAALASVWVLLRTGRRPISDMSTEWLTRTLALVGTLFLLVRVVFVNDIPSVPGLSVEWKYGMYVAFGASILQSLLAILNREASYVEPDDEEWDEDGEEGEDAEGEWVEGDEPVGDVDPAPDERS